MTFELFGAFTDLLGLVADAIVVIIMLTNN